MKDLINAPCWRGNLWAQISTVAFYEIDQGSPMSKMNYKSDCKTYFQIIYFACYRRKS